MTYHQDIEQAITALNAQKGSLADTVVETAVAALRQQLTALTDREISSSAMRGERKQVTVMFADISGFTAMSEKLDPEEVRGMINACFERLGAAIDRYDGHIDKFIGDEVMALFGAPVAHENDPERALRAALDMMDTLDEFNHEHAGQFPKPLALHFGINTGLVIAGGIGTQSRQDYSVMGDTVNLAARLEDVGEAGEILVGEDTYRLTAPLFEFETLQPVTVKGKEKPVRLYKLLKAKSITGGQIRGIEGLYSPLVGRKEELNKLSTSLVEVYQGEGGVVSVIGDIGLGKSRLVQELYLTCQKNGDNFWAEGRALSYGENASYLVTRQVLRQLLNIEVDTPPLEVELTLHKELEHYLPKQAEDIYPYLAHLLEIHVDEKATQRIKYLDGGALQRKIIESVQTYVSTRSANVPLVLVWEDLHWADPSSLHLLEALLPLARQCAILFLLVYRQPVKDSNIWAFHKKIGGLISKKHTSIKLSPLTTGHSAQLFDNLLGVYTIPNKIRDQIIAKADGNPFYLEEVIRSLIDTRAITPSDTEEGWMATPELDEIKLPDTLQGVIMARIDQLNPETKRVLQIASVMGRNFSYPILAQIMGNGGE